MGDIGCWGVETMLGSPLELVLQVALLCVRFAAGVVPHSFFIVCTFGFSSHAHHNARRLQCQH